MTEHLWRMYGNEHTCWCEPFPYPGVEILLHGVLHPLYLHRPDVGHVFWEHGEQGPLTLDQVIAEADA